jgi:hypothetical protein
MPILWWLRQEKPGFDKNQLRAGWKFWVETYTAWVENRTEFAPEWKRLINIGDIEVGPYVAIPIVCTQELIEEGEAMHHCVANYEDACRDGEYLILSIRERATWKRSATMSIGLRGKIWAIDQVRSYANKPAALPVRRAATAVADRVNAIFANTGLKGVTE